MDKILQFLYKLYKKIRPPKRLYQYGTIGLTIKDDRTLKEKFFDRIDEFFFNWQQEMRYKRANIKQVWHSYFDFGLGKVVSSSADIREQEKKGYAYISDDEATRLAERRQKQNRIDRRNRTQKYFEEGFAKIRSGNSNYYEQVQKRFRQ